MGTIAPPFILCPLSDRKELLGMSEDKLQNKIIITIGRNIAIRYYIMEQKQERSWTISQHWLTSKVVFCPEFDKYGAVIDNNIVGLWDEEDTTVNRFRIKLKLNQSVLELKPTKTLGTLVVFENGFVTGINKLKSMQDTLKQRDFKGVINTTKERIVEVVVNEAEGQVILVVDPSKDEQNSINANQRRSFKVLVIKLQLGIYDEEAEAEQELTCDVISTMYIKTAKKSKASRILGYCVIPGDVNSVVYIDSDGKLLEKKCVGVRDKDQHTCSEIGSVGSHVSLKTPVVMRYIEEGSALVIYGSDPSEEGAVVFLYDLKYDVLIAKQSLKLYGTPPIMEKIGRNVIVPVGLHILVLGVSISKSLLSAVVGKHRLKPGEEVFEQRNPWPTGPTGWEVDNRESTSGDKGRMLKQKKQKGPEHELGLIKKAFPDFWECVHQFKTLEKEGQPESVICNQIIPTILGNDNIPALDWIIDAVTDIPENLLVQVLSFLLKLRQDPFFARMCSSDSKENQSSDEKRPDDSPFTPDARINRLLFRDFDERELVRALPSMDFQQVRYFIQYLKFMMDYDWPVAEVESRRRSSEVDLQLSSSRWIKWISCVLNAHYTKFVINSEIDLIENMLVALEERTKLFDAIEDFAPYFLMTYNKVNFEPRPNPRSKWRSEVITFV